MCSDARSNIQYFCARKILRTHYSAQAMHWLIHAKNFRKYNLNINTSRPIAKVCKFHILMPQVCVCVLMNMCVGGECMYSVCGVCVRVYVR